MPTREDADLLASTWLPSRPCYPGDELLRKRAKVAGVVLRGRPRKWYPEVNVAGGRSRWRGIDLGVCAVAPAPPRLAPSGLTHITPQSPLSLSSSSHLSQQPWSSLPGFTSQRPVTVDTRGAGGGGATAVRVGSGCADIGGAGFRGADAGGAGSGGAGIRGVGSGGAYADGAGSWDVDAGGADSGGADTGSAGFRGTTTSGVAAKGTGAGGSIEAAETAPAAPRHLARLRQQPRQQSSSWCSNGSPGANMASWRFTGTYVDAVPPSWANIVNGIWIFKVKQPPG
ncbi:unnamed protein product [Closterium sp. NIES-54]